MLALAGALATCVNVYGIAQRRGAGPVTFVLFALGCDRQCFQRRPDAGDSALCRSQRHHRQVGWGMGMIRDTTSPTLLAVCVVAVLIGWAA